MLRTFVPNNGFVVRTPFADLCANTLDKVVFFTSKKIFENSSFILAISLADWHRRARGSLLWVVCPEMTSKRAAIQYTMGESPKYRSECPAKKLLVQDALNKPLRHPTKTRWRKCSYIGLPIHLVSIRIAPPAFIGSYDMMLWRGRESWLFSQRPVVLDIVCFAGKLQPMVYPHSQTQSGYIHNLKLSLANRWPLALLLKTSYWLV